MIASTAAQMVLVGYALLLLIGGFVGYKKAGSRPSLIAGAFGGQLALIAAGLMFLDPRAIWVGVVLTFMMTLVFAIRVSKTGKFLPSGMLGVLSMGVLVVLILAIV